jgi:protein involved in polysaccharide export with SLBB domain
LKVLARLWGRRYFLPCTVLVLFFYSTSSLFAQDVTVAGTPQQANERIKTLSSASKSSPREYTIGSGDLLSILVFDVPELTRDVRVSQSGTISIPLVPARIHVSGLTEIQAERTIADVLEANGLVSHPQVEVTVKEHRSRPITVVGAVQHPMVYEADRNVNLLEVLAEAGGISNDAGDTIIVTRARAATFIPVPNPEPISDSPPGTAPSATDSAPTPAAAEEKNTASSAASPALLSPADAAQSPSGAANSDGKAQTSPSTGNIVTINLNDLLESGDMRNNIPLQSGDVVTVPHAGIVYVLGAVNRPGGFVLSNDRTQMTTMKILALAGGLTHVARVDRAVIIRKDDQGKQTETQVDLKKVIDRQAEDLQMRASDILYVPDSKTKAALYQALQIGASVGTAVAIYRVAYQ